MFKYPASTSEQTGSPVDLGEHGNIGAGGLLPCMNVEQDCIIAPVGLGSADAGHRRDLRAHWASVNRAKVVHTPDPLPAETGVPAAYARGNCM